MVVELQPIILAAGEGSKMFPLTEGIPKCLLPIANVPIIWYVVNYLERSGFQDFIVVVRSAVAELIQQTLQSLCSSSKFDLVKLSDEKETGTVDALRAVMHKVKSDVLVVSCDMLTTAPLHRLIDIHRIYDASLTIMLANGVEIQVDKGVTGGKTKQNQNNNAGNRDFVAISSQEKRLLLFMNEGDIEGDDITIKKSTLKRYPSLKILTHLVDSHLYVMKKSILSYIDSNNKLENIKSDVIPLMVRKQFSKVHNTTENLTFPNAIEENEIIKDVNSYFPCNNDLTYMQEYSDYRGDCLKDAIKCHAFVSDAFCLRVNTIPAYVYINKQISMLKESIAPSLVIQQLHPTAVTNGKCQIGNDCLVGESSTCTENVIIKKSTIGKHCVIGPNVRITNCIIMNHVKILSGCNLQGCIVCNNAVLQANCALTNCQVAAGQTVKHDSNLKNEAIVVEEMEFDE